MTQNVSVGKRFCFQGRSPSSRLKSVFFFHSTGTCSYLTKPRDPSTTKDFHIFKSNPYIFDSKAALLLLVYLMYLIWQSWSSSQVVEVQTHRCLQRHLPHLKKTFQYLSVYFMHVKFRYANLNDYVCYIFVLLFVALIVVLLFVK